MLRGSLGELSWKVTAVHIPTAATGKGVENDDVVDAWRGISALYQDREPEMVFLAQRTATCGHKYGPAFSGSAGFSQPRLGLTWRNKSE